MGAREGGADHHGVRSRGKRLADVAPARHAAVRDDGDVATRALVVEVPRCRGVRRRRHLGHAEAQDLAARAGRAGAHPDEEGVHPAFHQLEAGLVGDHVADDERDGQVLLELTEIHRLVLGGDVAGRGHRGLDDEEVRARLLGDLGEALGPLRDGGDDHGPAALLDLRHALVDQLFLDGLAVDALDDLGRLFEAGRGDPVEHLVRILVAREDALEVEHGEAAEPAHLDGQLRADHAVHGRGHDGDLEAAGAELPRDVDFVGIDGERSGDQRDVVKAIRRPGLAPAPHPHAHTLPSSPGPGGSSPARPRIWENYRI